MILLERQWWMPPRYSKSNIIYGSAHCWARKQIDEPCIFAALRQQNVWKFPTAFGYLKISQPSGYMGSTEPRRCLKQKTEANSFKSQASRMWISTKWTVVTRQPSTLSQITGQKEKEISNLRNLLAMLLSLSEYKIKISPSPFHEGSNIHLHHLFAPATLLLCSLCPMHPPSICTPSTRRIAHRRTDSIYSCSSWNVCVQAPANHHEVQVVQRVHQENLKQLK